MQVKKTCPVCGSEIVTQLSRKALLDNSSSNCTPLEAAVYGYRCQSGHVFMRGDDRDDAEVTPAA